MLILRNLRSPSRCLGHNLLCPNRSQASEGWILWNYCILPRSTGRRFVSSSPSEIEGVSSKNMTKAETVEAYIRSHPTFAIIASMERYHHMGATLADAVLQRGTNYKKVVEPKIKNLLINYPEATTTSAFARVVREEGAAQVLSWGEGQKPETLLALIDLLVVHGVETEDDLRSWLENPDNMVRLQEIKGIKDKTAHYLQILVGIQTSLSQVENVTVQLSFS